MFFEGWSDYEMLQLPFEHVERGAGVSLSMFSSEFQSFEAAQ